MFLCVFHQQARREQAEAETNLEQQQQQEADQTAAANEFLSMVGDVSVYSFQILLRKLSELIKGLT